MKDEITEIIGYVPLNSDRIADMFQYGISTGAIAIIISGLVGFTINKFINLMKG